MKEEDAGRKEDRKGKKVYEILRKFKGRIWWGRGKKRQERNHIRKKQQGRLEEVKGEKG